MVSLKFVAVIVFLIQLHALGLCDTKDDAQNAISLLFDEVEVAKNLVESAVSKWSGDVSNISIAINDQLVDDIAQFKLLVHNVTLFAENYTDGEKCFGELDIFLNASIYKLDAVYFENVVFENLFSWAIADIQGGMNKYYELNQEFTQNCLNIENDCEGLSEGIIAEVDRVLPTIKGIPYRLLAEIYLLNYRIAVNWRSVQANIMEDYRRVIENATICLATTIRDYNQTTLEGLPQTPENLDDSIGELFLKMVIITESAASSAIVDLLSYVDDIFRQMADGFVKSITIVRNLTSTASNTVYSINDIAQDLNITINCNSVDVQSVANSSLTRVEYAYRGLLNELVNGQYAEGIKTITTIGKEVTSIEPQVEACKAEGTCDYLAEIIVSKTSELPLLVQKVRDSTSALLLRAIPGVWESGAKVARGLLEQLEIDILLLKSCVQNSL